MFKSENLQGPTKVSQKPDKFSWDFPDMVVSRDTRFGIEIRGTGQSRPMPNILWTAQEKNSNSP